jgi:hypothetical protein
MRYHALWVRIFWWGFLSLSLASYQPQFPPPTATSIPTRTRIIAPTQTVDELIEIIYKSDPDLRQYDPESGAYAAFPDALEELSAMGTGAIDTVSDLAVAVRFPRSDSYLAAQTLLELGPELTKLGIPILIDNLHHQKPDTHIYSAILIGSVGDEASCAVGEIAPLLWDSDSRVRSAVALALEKITEEELVPSQYEILITPSFMANSLPEDFPEGQIVVGARTWWNEQGSKTDWHSSYGVCDP